MLPPKIAELLLLICCDAFREVVWGWLSRGIPTGLLAGLPAAEHEGLFWVYFGLCTVLHHMASPQVIPIILVPTLQNRTCASPWSLSQARVVLSCATFLARTQFVSKSSTGHGEDTARTPQVSPKLQHFANKRNLINPRLLSQNPGDLTFLLPGGRGEHSSQACQLLLCGTDGAVLHPTSPRYHASAPGWLHRAEG